MNIQLELPSARINSKTTKFLRYEFSFTGNIKYIYSSKYPDVQVLFEVTATYKNKLNITETVTHYFDSTFFVLTEETIIKCTSKTL